MSPFVTEDGVNLIGSIADAAQSKSVRWVVGLDGFLTTPQSLVSILKDPRVVDPVAWIQQDSDLSLHSKVYVLKNSRPFRIAVYIGSSNATGTGLTTNVEAGVILSARGGVGRELDSTCASFLEAIIVSRAARVLNETEIAKYRKIYRPFRARRRSLGRIVGTDARSETGATAWIEVAVRGGSSNQLEICRRMVPYFLGTQIMERRALTLVDRNTGTSYTGNAYRFREGNFGHRVEFNTRLARKLRLSRAAQERNIVRFHRTLERGTFLVDIVPKRSRLARELRATARRDGRLFRTIGGPGGREYFVASPV